MTVRPNASRKQQDFVSSRRGRICDFPPHYLDLFALRQPTVYAERMAQALFDLSDVPQSLRANQQESR